MTRKIFLALLVSLILIETVFAYDVAYIVKTSANANSNVELALRDLGYSYEIITDSQIPSTDFSQYSILLIQDNVLNKAFLPLSTKNLLFIDKTYVPLIWPYPAWKPKANAYSSNTFTSNFEQLETPFTEGFSNLNFNAYTSTKGIYYLKIKPSNVNRVALTTGSTGIYGIVDYSNQNNIRDVFFGFYEISYWTAETKKLFKNSLKWVRMGVDIDNDGYYADADCNDNNADAWQYLQAYADNDNDGFGAGNLINVCSGNELPQGYSSINTDCNDNNSDINPNAIETFYDRIDQNCDGYDLADADIDGYCKQSYQITNLVLQCPKETGSIGTDCNDNNPDVNAGSGDINKNCAIIVNPINKITVHESQDAIVEIIASNSGSEKAELIYSIDSNKFVQDSSDKENKFIWSTGYYDSGNHKFNAIASNGIKESSVEFEVEVINKNKAPACSDIQELSWNEDETFEIDLKDYCSDLDNDNLIFSLKEMPLNNHVFLNSLEDGVAKFSAEKDWAGEEWIVFKVSDGADEIQTNKINLKVNPVNDAPVFNGKINDIIWDQNSGLNNRINLNDYFSDVDKDALDFSYSIVSGDDKIRININEDGLVSFSPETEWIGEEKVIFSASDRQSNPVNSNEVLLKVLYVNKPPKFNDLTCATDIQEDTDYECELSATDPENDNLVFSAAEQENSLNCNIEGNRLKYISFKDYYGPASCVLRVTDINEKYSDKIFSVQIENVNDPPFIRESFPINDYLKILENTIKTFRIIAIDIDSAKVIKWFVNGEEAGTENYYDFNKTAGNYNVTVVASDDGFTANNISRSWNVSVFNIGHFTCSEVNGYICSETQICSQNFLGVYDSERCCSVACSKKPPEFKAIKKPDSNKTDNIRINIKEPANRTKLKISEIFNVKFDVENRINEELDFDFEVYLYDLTKEKVITKEKSSSKIDKNTIKTIEDEIKTSNDLNEKDEYAVFIRTIGEAKNKQKYYNDIYVELGFERKEHYLAIKNLEIMPETGVVCGDYINVKLDVENLGRTDENIIMKLENSALKINEKTLILKIEKYGEYDTLNKMFFEIPVSDNAKAGNYLIKASILFGNQTISAEKTLELGECLKEKTEIESIETIKLMPKNPSSKVPVQDNDNGRKLLLAILGIFTIALMLVFIIGIIKYRKNMNEYLN